VSGQQQDVDPCLADSQLLQDAGAIQDWDSEIEYDGVRSLLLNFFQRCWAISRFAD